MAITCWVHDKTKPNFLKKLGKFKTKFNTEYKLLFYNISENYLNFINFYKIFNVNIKQENNFKTFLVFCQNKKPQIKMWLLKKFQIFLKTFRKFMKPMRKI